MPINSNIPMSYQAPNIQPQNALADYAAIQQIQGGQRQAEVSQMQLESLRRDQAALSKMQEAIAAKGGPADLSVAADEMIKSGIPQYFEQGLKIRQTLDKQRKFADLLGPTGGAAAPAAAPASEAYPGYNEAIGMTPSVNAMAPAAAAPSVNSMANRINQAYAIGTPEALAWAKAREEEMKPMTVGASSSVYNPQTGGFTQAPATPVAPPAPTDISKLIKERDALPPNSPNRPLYDRAIQDLGATAENARQRLRFDQNKFAWEKANPGFELKEADDGSVVGVNKRTLQAFPVTIGGAAPAATGGAPAAAPAATGAGLPGARIPAPQAPLAGATPTAGRPLMGKSPSMTETQSNAAMFGGAMTQAQNTIDQLEKKGTVKNAVVPGLLSGLVNMVPWGGGQGMSDVIASTFNADPTGLIGPDAAQQKLAQAQLAFATAYLRKTSGAAFGASEIANTIKEFFPLQGEGDSVIKQKAASRKRAVEGMKISTNAEGKKYIETFGGGAGGIAGATPSDPLGLGAGGR